jgi:hypothetical protein
MPRGRAWRRARDSLRIGQPARFLGPIAHTEFSGTAIHRWRYVFLGQIYPLGLLIERVMENRAPRSAISSLAIFVNPIEFAD